MDTPPPDPTSSDDVPSQEPLPKPVTSPITLDERNDGLTFTLPPAGFWRGSSGLGCFAIIWNGFMLLFTSLAGGSLIGMGKGDWSLLVLIPFLGLFWAVGIWVLLSAISMGKRRVIIDVVGDTLVITETKLRGTKQREWTREQITAVRSGPSGTTVNNRPLMQLQVLDIEGKKDGYLTGRDNDEVAWIADVLRRTLNL